MNARLYFTIENAESIKPIQELSVVRLKKDVVTPGGILPAGCRGTVVAILGTSDVYMIEFENPFHALESISCEMVELVAGCGRDEIIANIGIQNR